MSRSDQWIGLNDGAQNFIDSVYLRYPGVITRKIVLVSKEESMFGNEFYGAEIEIPDYDECSVNSKYIIREKVQDILCSGGNRYFTNLDLYCIKKMDNSFVLLADGLFSWRKILSYNFITSDFSYCFNRNDFDYVNGEYYA